MKINRLKRNILRQDGFTAIEFIDVVLVVALIGILASPLFMKFYEFIWYIEGGIVIALIIINLGWYLSSRNKGKE